MAASSLFDAVQQSSLERVKALVASGGDVNAVHPKYKQNLVFFAASRPLSAAGKRAEFAALLTDVYGLDAWTKDWLEQTPLFYAAKRGDAELCAFLLSKGGNADHCDTHGQTALFFAVSNGHSEASKLLIRAHCDVRRVDSYRKGLLHWSTTAACTDTLLGESCDPNLRDKEGMTALFMAARRGSVEQISLLIEHGADINVIDNKGSTCLHIAAISAQDHACVLLVETFGMDPTIQDKGGLTPRAAATHWKQQGTAEILETLERTRVVSRKTDAMPQQTTGERLYNAVRDAAPAVVGKLLETRANPQSARVQGGENLVFLASARTQGALEVCRLLVAHSVSPTLVDARYRQTPLFFAVRRGPNAGGLGCARYLMECRCDPDHADLREETPLFYAVQRDDPSCAEALIAAGAKVGHRNTTGSTAAFYSGRADSVESTRTLISARMDAGAKDECGHTALWEARSSGFAELLLSHQCDPNHRSNFGQTALFAVASRGSEDVLKLLVKKKSDAHAIDQNGQSCLFYAAMTGQARMCAILVEEFGVDPLLLDAEGSTAADIAARKGSALAESTLRGIMDRCTAASSSSRKRAAEEGGSADLTCRDDASAVSEAASRSTRQKYVLEFTDASGCVIPVDTPEYVRALRSLVEVCPWMKGWDGSPGSTARG